MFSIVPSQMRTSALILVLILLMVPLNTVIFEDNEIAFQTSGRSSGIDIKVDSVSLSYTNSADESKYRMFSSNYPIFGFNRPASLYTVDTVAGVPINLQVSISNPGTTDSGNFPVRVKVLHNDYERFELFNGTFSILNVAAGNSATGSIDVTVNYSGNHTLEITPEYQWIDENPNNDQLNRHFTVAYSYFNCDDFTGWTVGSEWSLNSDTSISAGRSCHVGNGEFSTYSANQVTSLTTPIIDMSDAHPNPSNTVGISFFYTGSGGAGDAFRAYAKNSNGNWDSLLTIQNTIDGTFQDGANWQTFSANANGFSSPVVPLDNSKHMHQNSQIKFELTADSSVEDIGYWFDEFVIIYDQVARASEYSFSSQGIQTTGALPGEWGKVSVEITNSGNISDRVIPVLNGVDQDWQYYFAHTTGATISQNSGFTLMPGETRQIDLFLQPDENETIGFKQLDLVFKSSTNSLVNTTLPVSFQVKPNRVPNIVIPDQRPSCAPGQTCNFQIEIQNIGQATDVFSISTDISQLASGWNVQLAWSQPSGVLVRPEMPVFVNLQMTVPSDAIPDSTTDFDLIATSQNDSSKFDVEEISISASLTSEIDIHLLSGTGTSWDVQAGQQVRLDYQIFNNASRQDILSIDVISSGGLNWEVVDEHRPSLFINSNTFSTISVVVIAPENAQAGDHGPTITVRATSERSGMVFESSDFDGLRVETQEDLELRILNSLDRIKPGEASMILLEIENNGNGESSAIINLPSLSDNWNWWIRINDQNHTGNIDLTASYDLGDIIQFELWILLPPEESSGEIHDVVITAEPVSGNDDLTPEDNSVEFSFITSSVKKPEISITSYPDSIVAGDRYSIQGLLTNSGNAPDNSVTFDVSISSSPQLANLVGFMTIKGTSHLLDGNQIQVSMLAGEEANFSIDLITPLDTELNTRIVVNIITRGGLNPDGFPYQLENNILTVVDKQRIVEVDFDNLEMDMIQYGAEGAFWLNLTSKSTGQETILISAEVPDGWMLVCEQHYWNGTDESIHEVILEDGSISPEYHNMICSVSLTSGDQIGDVVIFVKTEDELVDIEYSLSFEFEAKVEDLSLLSKLKSSSLLIFVLIAIILGSIILIRTVGMQNKDDVLAIEDHISHSEQLNSQIPNTETKAAPSGPPVTTTGPPANISKEDQSLGIQENDEVTSQAQITNSVPDDPPLPQSGLPQGWTMEQWKWYGHQYLEQLDQQN